MAKPCIICYRGRTTDTSKFGEHDKDRIKKAEVLKRFCTLFRRYIVDEIGNRDGQKDDENIQRFSLFERAINAGLLSCPECTKLIESFCELYKEMKSIELLLNWKATTLMNVMSSAQKVSSRRKYFRESVKLMQDSEVTPDEIINFKKDIVKICERRLKSTYPRLVIKRYCHAPDPTHTLGLESGGINSSTASSPPSTNLAGATQEITPSLTSSAEDVTDGSVLALMAGDLNNSNQIFVNGPPPVEIQHSDVISTNNFPHTQTNELELGVIKSAPSVISISTDSPTGAVEDTNSISSKAVAVTEYDGKLEADLNTPYTPFVIQNDVIKNSTAFGTDSDDSEAEYYNDEDDENEDHFEGENSESHLREEVQSDKSSWDVLALPGNLGTENGELNEGNNTEPSQSSQLTVNDHQSSIDFKSGKHKCKRCPEEFRDFNMFRQHYDRIHRPKLRFRCPQCRKIFLQRATYISHFRIVHMGVRFKCRKCSQSFTKKKTLRIHQRRGNCGGSFQRNGKGAKNSCGRPRTRRTKITNIINDIKVSLDESEEPGEASVYIEQLQTDNETGTVTTSVPNRRSLRTVHRCCSCNRTFSTNQRLTQHQKTDFCNLVESKSGGEDDEVGAFDDDDDDHNSDDTQSPLLTDYDDDESEFNFDQDSSGDEEVEQKVKVLGRDELQPGEDKNKKLQFPCGDCSKQFTSKWTLNRHQTVSHPLEWRGRQGSTNGSILFYRFKCPDCEKLFLQLHSMLLHRSESHKSSDDKLLSEGHPGRTLNVQILSFLEKPSTTVGSNRKNNSKIFATIETPSQVFSCNVPNCGEPFYSWTDLEIHSKLHGHFKCNYCDMTKDFAPDLAEHELEHSRKIKRTFVCPRCDATFPKNGKYNYVSHHLDAHLSLSINNGTCAICKAHCYTRFKESCGDRIFGHYKTCHDKGQQQQSQSTEIKKCPIQNCVGYFLKPLQLVYHLQRSHQTVDGLRDLIIAQLKCKTCGQQFTSSQVFQAHEENLLCHFEENKATGPPVAKGKNKRYPFQVKCLTCSTLFGHVYQLLRHHQQAHPRPLSNKVSEEGKLISMDIIQNKQVLARIRAPETVFPCPESNCQQGFYLEEDLETHAKLHGSFQCEFCDVVKSFAPELAKHELEHTQEDVVRDERGSRECWNCARCKHQNKYGRDYLLHHLNHHLCLPFVGERCAICKTGAFASNVALMRHYKNSHNLNNVDGQHNIERCGFGGCSAYFLHKQRLTLHYRTSHGMDKKQIDSLKQKQSFYCKDCGKFFATKYYFQAHRLKEHVNLYPCASDANCKKAFETKVELDEHVGHWHSSKRSFTMRECEKCSKMINSIRFTSHMNWHKRKEDIEAGLIELTPIPKKPAPETQLYVCELCGKGFKHKWHLETHSFSHSGPSSWKFTCGVCSKKCISQQKLDEHMRIHSKEKPFVCDLCGEKYAHRHNLRIHVNSKHGDVTQDIPKKHNFVNLTSRKGIKRKK